MRAEEKQHYRHAEKELLRGGVLISIVDLLPHVQVVVGTSIEFEWHAADIVEHEIGAEHVGDIGQGPRRFCGDTGNDVE